MPPSLEVLVERLKAQPMLQALGPEGLAELSQAAQHRSYAAGEVVFLEGEAVAALYVVEQGWVKVVKMAPDGREQILYFWGPGELFGGVGVFVHRPAPATAIALEASQLWVLPRSAIRTVLAANPAMALGVLEFMADRMSELIELVADLSLNSVTARLARLLLEQASEDVLSRQRWATQSELAARLGTVPDVLSRALRALVEEGLIQLSRQQIRILNREGLAAKAAPPR